MLIDVSMISPYGTSPSLISAWKPLQMPSIRPSRLLEQIMHLRLSCAGLRKNAVMNFAGAVGFVAAGKTAGQDNHLAARNACELASAIDWVDGLRRQVVA